MRRVVVASCIASFLAPLASTMMNLSLVAIGEEFSVGSHDLGMVSTSFLLASVMVMIPVTKLADIWGLRKVFLARLALLGGAAGGRAGERPVRRWGTAGGGAASQPAGGGTQGAGADGAAAVAAMPTNAGPRTKTNSSAIDS